MRAVGMDSRENERKELEAVSIDNCLQSLPFSKYQKGLLYLSL